MHAIGRLVLEGALAAALLGCAAVPPADRMDNRAMYGQPDVPRPTALLAAEADFVATASAKVGSRQQASAMWAAVADRYMNERNLILAMRRYNQAWLLDPQNFQAYWGFGRIELERDQFDESLTHFRQAEQLDSNSFQKPALLSDSGVAHMFNATSLPETQAAERGAHFQEADRRFAESVSLDPTYINVYRHWIRSLYLQGDYTGAWKKVAEARRRNAAVPATLLGALEQKMQEPAVVP